MPTYQYRCTECGRDTEMVQAFTDAPLTECPHCGGRLRKQYGAVGVVFKGSGFYRTDSRRSENGDGKSAGTTKKDAPATTSAGASGGDSSGGSSGGEKKPAAPAPAAASTSGGSTGSAA